MEDTPISCPGQPILQADLVTSIKMSCTSTSCTQSGFLHPSCLTKVEEVLIRHLGHTGTKTSAREKLSQIDWSQEKERRLLWRGTRDRGAKGALGLHSQVGKLVRCRCGGGFLRRDLDWPPPQVQRAARVLPGRVREPSGKVKEVQRRAREAGRPVEPRPQLNKNRAWVSLKPFSYEYKGAGSSEVTARGKETVIPGLEPALGPGAMEGAAAMVEGRVTHWVPEHLAGVIQTEEGDVLVTRAAFIPGGFVPDIVGRRVEFRLDRAAMEAAGVRCLERGARGEGAVVEQDGVQSMGHQGGAVPGARTRLLDCSEPAVARAVSGALDVAALSEEQLEEVVVALEPHLASLARHATGHRTVMQLLQVLPPTALEVVVGCLTTDLACLSLTAAGSEVLVTAFSLLPPALAELLASPYSGMPGPQVWHLMTHRLAAAVFRAAAPHLAPLTLRHLVAAVGPALASLPFHPSLLLVAEKAVIREPAALAELAVWLDRAQLLLSPHHLPILRLLLATGGTRITGIFLNVLSGKLHAVTQEEAGLRVLELLLLHGSDLQVGLLLEELLAEGSGGLPPLALTLATEVRGNPVMEAVEEVASGDVLGRLVQVLEQERVAEFRGFPGSMVEVARWAARMRERLEEAREAAREL